MFTIQAPKAKTPQFPPVKRTRKMPRKAHGFLPRGGEEAAEVADACVQPPLPRGLVSISTRWDGVWQLHNRQEICDPRIHLAPILALEKPVLPNSENPISINGVSKAKKEAPALPKAKAKAKALKTKKAVLKGIHSHKEGEGEGIRMPPTFRKPKTLQLRRQPKYPQKTAPRRNVLHHYAIIKIALTTKSAMKKIEDNSTPVFTVEVRANQHQIKQAVKKLCDVDVATVGTLIRPDGTKKALAPDYDASDVSNKN
ncbi:LOW QUALITY PROTEIN: large ribosomal subunit protein uL23-like [Glossophaga mutica]